MKVYQLISQPFKRRLLFACVVAMISACSDGHNSLLDTSNYPGWRDMPHLDPPSKCQRSRHGNRTTHMFVWPDRASVKIETLTCASDSRSKPQNMVGWVRKGENIYFSQLTADVGNGVEQSVPNTILGRLANPLPDTIFVARVNGRPEHRPRFLIALEGGDGERAWQVGLWMSKDGNIGLVPPLFDYAEVSKVLALGRESKTKHLR